VKQDKFVQSNEDIAVQKELQQLGSIPEHIAIIMDGNGRWAKSKGNMRIYGHKVGVDSVRDIVESCAQLGVKHLTLYAFSTENWNRPEAEVGALMQILIQSLRKEARRLNKNNIRLTTIGQTDRFPAVCKSALAEAMDLTKDNDRMQLCLALSYSGRWDIVQAVKKIASKVESDEITIQDINDELISNNLATASIPDPDLIIRTSGEFAYSELYITDTFWPDFRRDELYKAIESYQKRERRFGKISEQITETINKA
jgi:undecaprenyl diphosphate synthase